ncbi:PREDICTED: probable inactive receptor-like protein kinase At3g56050, partial [Erythranthe guttata]|uniref:probable inactive receptor-like protein kinase At3g56050 n=1 Tax=Erythranthe guttata TaxID=4155 RepID=UPI00064DBA69
SGVLNFKRSEVEFACEYFTNVIGSSSLGTLYKGTLSTGVEIAVAAIAFTSANDWSNSLEALFRDEIDTLSKVNHKNFMNLVGSCAEEEPFTRMLVFEYAPYETLFEHLHLREAEHLDWEMRLRIAMGIAYCLEHMHQLIPPLFHRNLNSSAVYLSEDYAAKVSDFAFLDEIHEPNMQSNVYSFGIVLLEIITGRLPYSAGSLSVGDWASDYLSRTQPLREMVDPTLKTFREDQLQQIGDVIRLCANSKAMERPNMEGVWAKLRVITGIEPHEAIPRVLPLWLTELETPSTRGQAQPKAKASKAAAVLGLRKNRVFRGLQFW